MTYMQDASGFTINTSNPEYYADWKRLSVAAGKAAMRDQSLASLRDMLKPGDTVYCVLRSNSPSGMSRRIDFFVMRDNQPRRISGHIANILSGVRQDNKEGLRVDGGGMDMGFHVVYSLGSAMWRDGTPEPHGTRNGQPDSDGGYALKSEWL